MPAGLTHTSWTADDAPVSGTLRLVIPDWQGHGADRAIRHDTIAAAHALFDAGDWLHVDAPADETLVAEAGVLGLASIAARTREALAALDARRPDRVFLMAGTCGAELAPVAWLNARHGGDLAVVWLDAHGDLNTPASSPSGRFHGMVLRTLMGEGPAALAGAVPRPLAARQVFLAGTRDLDPPEARFIAGAGVSVTPPADLADPAGLCDRIRAAGLGRVYVHLDLDVLDPAAFPDVLVPAPGGLTTATAAAAVCALAEGFEVAGLSLVEFRDRTGEGLARLQALAREIRPAEIVRPHRA